MEKIKGREMQTQGQHIMCYQRGNQNPRHKISPPPSKPNLPNVPKPSKLLLQRDYTKPISSLVCRILLLDHSINQYEIGPFLTTSQTPNGALTDMGMVRKGFGNVPLKDLTIERKRVEEFKESVCENCE